eukprot:Clim_evm40s44 gene=Clim_evmTU40s44
MDNGRAVKRSASFVESKHDHNRISIIFAIDGDRIGALQDVLTILKESNVNLRHIESRPSRQIPGAYDLLVDVESAPDTVTMDKVSKSCINVRTLNEQDEESPWFPRLMRDMDKFATETLEYGSDLDADHPGFNDPEYRKRRLEITWNAKNYKYGQPLPRVEYTEQEKATWREVWTQLTKLYPTHACSEYNRMLPLLIENCGYGPDDIPQIADIDQFLHDTTGFRLRPVAGLLSSRDFLNGLAFRTFHSTQYIRHPSKPLYTPEPDVCHELLGHVPLFADPSFADFSQEIGLASLGATDDEIKRLATVYWFTIEFGVCRQHGQIKAYGAGLLSSFGELQYCLTDEPKHKQFVPEVTSLTEYPITSYQPTYFVAESFDDAKEKVRAYARTLSRKFGVRYNPYTESIEILDSTQQVSRVISHVQGELAILNDSLRHMM